MTFFAGFQQWHRGHDISNRQARDRLQTIPTDSITKRDRQIGRRQRHREGKSPAADPETAREERAFAADAPGEAHAGLHAQKRQNPGGSVAMSAQHAQ